MQYKEAGKSIPTDNRPEQNDLRPANLAWQPIATEMARPKVV